MIACVVWVGVVAFSLGFVAAAKASRRGWISK